MHYVKINLMKAITLRNLPPRVARMVRQKAEAEGASINKSVIRLLEEREAFRQIKGRKVRHRDLDALAGSWTRKDAAVFERHLASLRTIDPELWK